MRLFAAVTTRVDAASEQDAHAHQSDRDCDYGIVTGDDDGDAGRRLHSVTSSSSSSLPQLLDGDVPLAQRFYSRPTSCFTRCALFLRFAAWLGSLPIPLHVVFLYTTLLFAFASLAAYQRLTSNHASLTPVYVVDPFTPVTPFVASCTDPCSACAPLHRFFAPSVPDVLTRLDPAAFDLAYTLRVNEATLVERWRSVVSRSSFAIDESTRAPSIAWYPLADISSSSSSSTAQTDWSAVLAQLNAINDAACSRSSSDTGNSADSLLSLPWLHASSSTLIKHVIATCRQATTSTPPLFAPFSPAWSIPFVDSLVASHDDVLRHSAELTRDTKRVYHTPVAMPTRRVIVSLSKDVNTDMATTTTTATTTNLPIDHSPVDREATIDDCANSPSCMLALAVGEVKLVVLPSSTSGYTLLVDTEPSTRLATHPASPIMEALNGADGLVSLTRHNAMRRVLLRNRISPWAQHFDIWVQSDGSAPAADYFTALPPHARPSESAALPWTSTLPLRSQWMHVFRDDPWLLFLPSSEVQFDAQYEQHPWAHVFEQPMGMGKITVTSEDTDQYYRHSESCLDLARQIRPIQIVRTDAAAWQAAAPERAARDYAERLRTFETVEDVCEQRVCFHMYWIADSLHPQAVLAIKSFLATQDLRRVHLIVWSDRVWLDQSDETWSAAPVPAYVLRPLLASPPHGPIASLQTSPFTEEFTALYNEPAFQHSLSFAVWDANTMLAESSIAAHASKVAGATDAKHWADGDLMRLVVLEVYGGVYVDMDAVLLRDFTPLLHQEWLYQWDHRTNWMNGAFMHFYRRSWYVADLLKRLVDIPAGGNNWDCDLYIDRYKELRGKDPNLWTVLPVCFFDGFWDAGTSNLHLPINDHLSPRRAEMSCDADSYAFDEQWFGEYPQSAETSMWWSDITKTPSSIVHLEDVGQSWPTFWSGPFGQHLHGRVFSDSPIEGGGSKIEPFSDLARLRAAIDRRLKERSQWFHVQAKVQKIQK